MNVKLEFRSIVRPKKPDYKQGKQHQLFDNFIRSIINSELILHICIMLISGITMSEHIHLTNTEHRLKLNMEYDIIRHKCYKNDYHYIQKFEEQFYQTKGIRTEGGTTVPIPKFEAIVEKEENVKDTSKEVSDIETLAKSFSNSETADLLKALAKQL